MNGCRWARGGVFVFLGLVLGAVVALGQDMNVSPRAMGMGGGNTAFSDDATAIWSNPGGLGGQRTKLTVSWKTFTHYEFDFTDTGASDDLSTVILRNRVGMTEPIAIPAYFGFVMPISEHFTLGIAHVRPFDLKYSMRFRDPFVDADGAGPGTAGAEFLREYEQRSSRFRAALGFRCDFREEGFLSFLGLGVGGDFTYTTLQVDDFLRGNAGPPLVPQDGRPTQSTDDSALGLGAGAGILLGVYQSPSFAIDLGGNYNSDSRYEEFIFSEFTFDRAFMPAIHWPQSYSAGMTISLFENWPVKITGEVNWSEWGKAAPAPESITVVGKTGPVTSTPLNTESFRTAVSYSGGMEYRMRCTWFGGENVWLLPRVGYRHQEAPWGEDRVQAASLGINTLILNSNGPSWNIATCGLGIEFHGDDVGSPLRRIDLAAEVGGDDLNFSIGYTHDW